MNRPPPVLGFRMTAYVVWGSLLFGVLAFTAIAAFVGPGLRSRGAPVPDALAHLSLAVAVGGVLASRIVPPRLRRAAAQEPDAFAMSRNIVAAALCEGPALLGIIAWMLTGSATAVVAIAIAIAGLVSCFPRDARWRWLTSDGPGRPGSGGPSRMVR